MRLKIELHFFVVHNILLSLKCYYIEVRPRGQDTPDTKRRQYLICPAMVAICTHITAHGQSDF